MFRSSVLLGSLMRAAVLCAGVVTMAACGSDATSPVGDDPRWALAWADQPSAASTYDVDEYYSSSSTDTTAIRITRASAGTYAVRFPKAARRNGWKDAIHVSAYGSTMRRCRVQSWGNDGADMVAQVRCHDNTGTLADSYFDIVLATGAAMEGRGAFALSTSLTGGTAAGATVYSPVDRPVTIENTSTGVYSVTFQGLSRAAVSGSGNEIYHVTAYGDGTDWCKVSSWGDDGDDAVVTVRCFNVAGGATNARFGIMLLERGREGGKRLGYAWANASTTASYTPSTSYSFNSTGGAITGAQLSTGVYTMTWAGLGRLVGSAAETNLVSAYGSSATWCQVSSWGSTSVTVRCFDTAGAAANSQYDVIWIE